MGNPSLLLRILWFFLFRSSALRRKPDRVIGVRGEPDYMWRWFVIPRNPWFNIYYHEILRSDHSFALHDHPWWNISVVLKGSYTEHTIKAGGVHVRKLRQPGDLVFRLAKQAHRIELEVPVATLFITGPRFRVWGFHCKSGWRPFNQVVNPDGTKKGECD